MKITKTVSRSFGSDIPWLHSLVLDGVQYMNNDFQPQEEGYELEYIPLKDLIQQEGTQLTV
jgi:hypothetical protein